MNDQHQPTTPPDKAIRIDHARQIQAPLMNYTLSTVCPACEYPTVRRACKVRCDRCGFMWDCSEL